MTSWFVVFVAYFALDFVWARYNTACAERSRLPASCYATAIVFLAGTAQVLYTHEPSLLVPAAVGAFLGTWVSFWKPAA